MLRRSMEMHFQLRLSRTHSHENWPTFAASLENSMHNDKMNINELPSLFDDFE